jgi:hypothetical protein
MIFLLCTLQSYRDTTLHNRWLWQLLIYSNNSMLGVICRCGSHDHHLYALNYKDRCCTYKVSCGGSIYGSPAVDMVFLLINSMHVLNLRRTLWNLVSYCFHAGTQHNLCCMYEWSCNCNIPWGNFGYFSVRTIKEKVLFFLWDLSSTELGNTKHNI